MTRGDCVRVEQGPLLVPTPGEGMVFHRALRRGSLRAHRGLCRGEVIEEFP